MSARYDNVATCLRCTYNVRSRVWRCPRSRYISWRLLATTEVKHYHFPLHSKQRVASTRYSGSGSSGGGKSSKWCMFCKAHTHHTMMCRYKDAAEKAVAEAKAKATAVTEN